MAGRLAFGEFRDGLDVEVKNVDEVSGSTDCRD